MSIPVEGPPIENGCLTIEHGRIAWVGSSSDRTCDMNLGNVAATHWQRSVLECSGRCWARFFPCGVQRSK